MTVQEREEAIKSGRLIVYTDYDFLNVGNEYENPNEEFIKRVNVELARIENCEMAEIMLKPKNKNYLFILGMLFSSGVRIKILNEEIVTPIVSNSDIEAIGKTHENMSYVWSRIGDPNFPANDNSNIKCEFDKFIYGCKASGTNLERIVSCPEKNKKFLISPVRLATEKETEWLESLAHQANIHVPKFHTNQVDPLCGYNICKQNGKAIAVSEEVQIYYNQTSTGSVFDIGMAYAMHKPLVLLNGDAITFDDNNLIDSLVKSWTNNEKAKIITQTYPM